MDSTERKTACITGATSGIGAAFAARFAGQGYDLILTGRRREKIQSLADALSARHGIRAEVVIAELSDGGDVASLAERVRTAENLDVLVNNAGFAREGLFHEEAFATHEAMVEVHDTALIRLCHAALPAMVSRGSGRIVNVSSLVAFMPAPGNAIYAASKSFVKVFTESLSLELRGTGVRVQALCPGFTRTDFHERMGYDRDTFYLDRGLMKAMTPEEVVDISLRYLERDRVVCIPGGNNRLSAFLLTVLPRAVAYRAALSAMRAK